MNRQDLIQFKNLNGKPIEATFTQNESQLVIHLKKSCTIDWKLLFKNNQIKSDKVISKKRKYVDTKRSHLNWCKHVSYDDKMINFKNSSDCCRNPCSYKSPIGCSRRIISHDMRLVKTLTMIVIFTMAVTSIAYTTIQLSDVNSSVNQLPYWLVVSILSRKFLSILYKRFNSYNIEETLIFTRISNDKAKFEDQKSPTMRQSIDRDLVPREHFLHRKSDLTGFIEHNLPYENLKLREILKDGRIIYALVVQSNLVSQSECFDVDGNRSNGDNIQHQNFRNISKCCPLGQQFTMTTPKDEVVHQMRAEQRIIFSEIQPRLDCIEFILTRVKSFVELSE